MYVIVRRRIFVRKVICQSIVVGFVVMDEKTTLDMLYLDGINITDQIPLKPVGPVVSGCQSTRHTVNSSQPKIV